MNAFNNFRDDLKWLATQNNDAKLKSVYSPTYYSDMSFSEFQSAVLMNPAKGSSNIDSSQCLPSVTGEATSSLPRVVNWRLRYMTDVKNQKNVSFCEYSVFLVRTLSFDLAAQLSHVSTLTVKFPLAAVWQLLVCL